MMKRANTFLADIEQIAAEQTQSVLLAAELDLELHLNQ
jgi:hypothetical protein